MNPDMPLWANPLIFELLMFVSFFVTLTVEDIVDNWGKRDKDDVLQ